MKRLIALLLALLLLAGCSTARHENAAATDPQPSDTAGEQAASVHPLLWRVKDDAGHTLYLFGTIHAGDLRMWDALTEVNPVLSACDALAVEFDTVAFEENYAAAVEMMTSQLYTDGTTVRDHVTEAQYDWLQQTLQDVGMYNAMLDYYTLGMWEMTAEQALLMRYSSLDMDLAMDRQLILDAYELGKPVYDVESAAFQYGLISAFPDELYRIKIDAYRALGGEAYGAELDALYEAWLAGDLAAINACLEDENDVSGLTAEQQAIVEDYNRQMMDERNLGMRDKALGYLQSGETVFFAVGTAHMLGEAGLVQLLTEAGCTVEPVRWQNGYQTEG